MKKYILILLCTIIFCMTGCNNRSMNYIIEHESSVTGVVKEVHDKYIRIYIENDSYPSGAECDVSLNVENKDGLYSPIHSGDKVTVYFDGSIAESDPMQINTVYAITLLEPADRSINESE